MSEPASSGPTHRHFSWRTLFSKESFLEKLILFLVAAFSWFRGVAAPAVINYVNQKAARDNARVEAQAKLLSDFSDTTFTYESLALDVSWFGSQSKNRKQNSGCSQQVHNANAPLLWAKWRLLIARANIYASSEAARQMANLFDAARKQDLTLILMSQAPGMTTDNWNDAHCSDEQTLVAANEVGIRAGQRHGPG